MELIRFFPASFFRLCEGTTLGQWIIHGQWYFAVIETVHIMAVAILLGSIAVVDLRLLGYGLRRQQVACIARQLAPWTLSSLAVMVLTGIPMFLSEAIKMGRNESFFWKMLLLIGALAVYFTLHWKITIRQPAEEGGFAKLTACLSLLLWFGVALAGRAIAFFG